MLGKLIFFTKTYTQDMWLFLQINKTKANNSDFNRHFAKEDNWMVNKHMTTIKGMKNYNLNEIPLPTFLRITSADYKNSHRLIVKV